MKITELLDRYSDKYLICDGEQPLLTYGSVAEEMMLYNIADEAQNKILSGFTAITGKILSPDTNTNQLSGGQKVILAVLLSLASPSPALLFHNLEHGLDKDKRSRIYLLIEQAKSSNRVILTLND